MERIVLYSPIGNSFRLAAGILQRIDLESPVSKNFNWLGWIHKTVTLAAFIEAGVQT